MCSLVATHCRRGSCEMAESSREEGILGSPEKKKKKKQFLQLFSPFMPRYECKAWDLCPWDSGCGCQE